ncbi:MAG: hypothetical protein KAR13_02445, partial [Desulfobulbaceae bacterium]|nr:hypothetical protein [Desulfobulbaceae bacterium]
SSLPLTLVVGIDTKSIFHLNIKATKFIPLLRISLSLLYKTIPENVMVSICRHVMPGQIMI